MIASFDTRRRMATVVAALVPWAVAIAVPDAFRIDLPLHPIGAAALPTGALLLFAALSSLVARPQVSDERATQQR